MTVPSEVITEIGTGAGGLVDMIWQIAPILIPVAIAVLAVRFVPKLLKSFGR